MPRLLRFLSLLAIAAACLPVAGAAAASYTVTTTADSGAGSLRAAITASNDPAVTDTITITATGAIELETALPIVIDDVTISGPGAGSLVVRRAAGAPFRIFQFGNVSATVRDLTVSNGLETGAGGILSSGGSLTLTRVVVTGNEAVAEGSTFALATAGGIYSSGALTLRESFVHDNRAIASDGSIETIAGGGGIEATGPVTVERSTISDNLAEAVGGGDETNSAGGGLLLMGGLATISQSTISGNSAIASGGSSSNVAQGGGLYGGGVTLTGSTVARNAVETTGSATVELARGSNLQHPGSSLIRDSIVAEPLGSADSCGSSPISGGFNLDEDGSCELGEGSDLAGVVAGLEPLAANGGLAPTHALAAGSAAVDRGSSFGYATDQRGLLRPSDFASISNAEGGDGSDIGAFELQLPPPPGGGGTPVIVSERPTDNTPPNTRIVSGPARSTFKPRAKFRFASTEAQSRFQCKLDKKGWKACANPFKASVKPGKHVFKVRAIDRFGNVDPTPARFGWRVKPIVG